jgi:hypothetical protein
LRDAAPTEGKAKYRNSSTGSGIPAISPREIGYE